MQAAASSFENARVERLSSRFGVTSERAVEARTKQHLPELGIAEVVRVLREIRFADHVVDDDVESRVGVVSGYASRSTPRESKLPSGFACPLHRTRESRPHPIPNVVYGNMHSLLKPAAERIRHG